mmetsp:Transcript_15103/g.35578  ORF Transcript_15103/g.35578 Transcript_15103/m.35578 type:complete len:225 (+) Transcript_15103:1998-2672(+)
MSLCTSGLCISGDVHDCSGVIPTGELDVGTMTCFNSSSSRRSRWPGASPRVSTPASGSSFAPSAVTPAVTSSALGTATRLPLAWSRSLNTCPCVSPGGSLTTSNVPPPAAANSACVSTPAPGSSLTPSEVASAASSAANSTPSRSAATALSLASLSCRTRSRPRRPRDRLCILTALCSRRVSSWAAFCRSDLTLLRSRRPRVRLWILTAPHSCFARRKACAWVT